MGLLKLVERDIKDCQIVELSADRRFATAYNAALGLANYVIRKQGYRVVGKIGHHKISFELAGELLGPRVAEFIDFFDLCRRKRNQVYYDFTDVVSESEVSYLIEVIKKFRNTIPI